MPLNRDQLAQCIEKNARSKLAGDRLADLLRSGFTSATKAVKAVFGDLGKELGYRVAAAGYRGADDGEWLYDMVWYEVDEKELLLQLRMVLESELKPGGSVSKSADVDGDFQKLVQARADVRVWLTACPNQELVAKHIANCKFQVQRFAESMPSDIYIFIVYDWTTGKTSVERFQPPVPDDPHVIANITQ